MSINNINLSIIHLNLIQRRLIQLWLGGVRILMTPLLLVFIGFQLELLVTRWNWYWSTLVWSLFWFAVIFLLFFPKMVKKGGLGKIIKLGFWTLIIGYIVLMYMTLGKYGPLAYLVMIPLAIHGAVYFTPRANLSGFFTLIAMVVLFRFWFCFDILTKEEIYFDFIAILLFMLVSFSIVANVRRLDRMRARREELFRLASSKSSDLRRTNCLLSEAYEQLSIHNAEMEKLNQMLSQAFDELSQRNASMERELDLAAKIQKSLVSMQWPQLPGFHIEASFIPFDKVGGDLFIIKQIQQSIWIFVTDVSGHGMPAALVAAICHGSFHRHSGEFISPAQVLQQMNDELTPYLSGFYFTACLIRFDMNSDQALISLAGHPFPVLITPSGDLKQIEGENPILGIFPQLEIKERVIPFPVGSRILLFTDGLYECRSPKGENLGSDRLCQYFSEHKKVDLKELMHGTMQFVHSFLEGMDKEDDLTMLAIERTTK